VKELNSFEEWQASLHNFLWLRDAVPGATDLDFFCHCSTRGKDWFLVLEFKPAGVSVSKGQKIAFDALSNLQVVDGGFEVVVVHGPDDEGLYFLSGDWTGKVDKGGLEALVRNWWHAKKSGKRKDLK
jgi:hypothetical protein